MLSCILVSWTVLFWAREFGCIDWAEGERGIRSREEGASDPDRPAFRECGWQECGFRKERLVQGLTMLCLIIKLGLCKDDVDS
ncbi:hypothetical protein B0H17DRAFT_1080173 [Mycena rosella]|uniref:Secreted protein n=1 Tax=Mycena rosella TaxID=1033263 RepID=A0AAD7D3H2_MYCRO|nr:hypothetical protein B0H17DRAFT_1080173 [Mycena rosella]